MTAAEIRYDRRDMARWEPNARGRLEEAAMALFLERGYAETTVEEIAARAGLTERTFFRYFADKREVLFWGSSEFLRVVVEGIAAAPIGAAPLDAVTAAFEAIGEILEPRRKHAIARQQVISAHAELREREQMKLTSVAAAIARALHERAVPEPAASLAGEAGVAIFKVAFERWVADAKARRLSHHLGAARSALEAVVAAKPVAKPATPSRRARARS
jgi:AcrR family transcriptional regulator